MSILSAISNLPGVNQIAQGGIQALDDVSPGSPGVTLKQNIASPSTNYLGAANPVSSGTQASSGNNAATSTANSGSATGSGTYTGGTDATTQANIAAYQDQITALNQLLSNADINQQQGQSAINTGYNNSLAQLQGNNQNVLQGYNTQQTNTTGDYNQALNSINSNARNGYNSLEALLGGSGSAGDILAPFAVSTQANQQRGASSNAYAQNLQAIQNGINSANLNFNTQKKSLDDQQGTQLQSLLNSIAQQKIQYQQQLGADQNQINIAKGGSYQTPTANNDIINQLLAQQQSSAQQYSTPQFTVSDYTAPTTNLSDYQSQAAALAGNGSTDTSQNDPSVALSNLLKQTQNTNQYSY